jgi:PAS domain-containing protein
MCLAAIVREREAGEIALRDRLRFEQVLSELARAFVHPSSPEMDEVTFDSWLALCGKRLQMDRMVVLVHGAGGILDVHYAWASAAIESRNAASSRIPAAIPRVAERILAIEMEGQGAAILGVVHSWVEVPDVGWLLTVPLVGAGRVLGAFVSVRRRAIEPEEAEELTRRLDLLADVLAGALVRKEAEDELRGREEMKTAILSSLGIGVAVLDREGTIVTVNDSWGSWMDADEAPAEGKNYLEEWRARALAGDEPAAAVVAGIESVIEGSRPGFACDLACPTAAGAVRSLTLSVLPLAGRQGGEGSVVVAVGTFSPGRAATP